MAARFFFGFIMEAKKLSYWRNNEMWVCTNHLPSILIPAVADRCWYPRCPSRRPDFIEFEKPECVIYLEETLCSYKHCKNGTDGRRALRKKKMKYCSHECRKNKARRKYAEKKRAERKANASRIKT